MMKRTTKIKTIVPIGPNPESNPKLKFAGYLQRKKMIARTIKIIIKVLLSSNNPIIYLYMVCEEKNFIYLN